tara:strand:+ start:860 stop:1282 length:423 start_codon:yes stop_codon:yes gene_type:complete
MATDAKTGQPIYRGAPGVGLRNVGSYQISGHPFVTGGMIGSGTESKVSFPYITKKITVIQSGSGTSLRVHFTPKSASPDNVYGNHHYITLDGDDESIDFDVKCKEIYLYANSDTGFEIYASLTNIPTSSMYALTGSGLTE